MTSTGRLPAPDGHVPAGDRPFLRPRRAVAEVPRLDVGPDVERRIARRVGLWAGRQAEVVYDPRRYVVMFTEGAGLADAEAALELLGWERLAADGNRTLWCRDRLASARSALASTAPAVRQGPVVEVPGR